MSCSTPLTEKTVELSVTASDNQGGAFLPRGYWRQQMNTAVLEMSISNAAPPLLPALFFRFFVYSFC